MSEGVKQQIVALEPDNGEPNLVNLIGWEALCCEGPLELLEMANRAGSEGVHLLRCPRCAREYAASMWWREVGTDQKRAIDRDRQRLRRARIKEELSA